MATALMLGDIIRFLLEITFTLFGAALILRAWIHAVRLHPFNPLARAIYQGTNWLVLPLRRVIPATGSIDWTSLIAAWVAALIYLILVWLSAVGALPPASALPSAMGSALLMVLKWTLNLMVWMTLIQAVLSWVNPLSPLMPLLQALTAPLLDPIRRILPRTAIDFSPLVLLIGAQILLMMVARLAYGIFGV
ncbi:YggT family protein [Bordetella parapertussis]|uniref:YggT family protein n=1 Tax=Bordetella parapertussis TaxID=519 RepID=A0ABU5X0T7_BORPP|nr:YggT family protein [Bordetella parapertussis]MEB2657742.1 YggT family protein [Bordetella parapertussis]MEB2662523.1 YggT family protein [Bordetella parapertussis]